MTSRLLRLLRITPSAMATAIAQRTIRPMQQRLLSTSQSLAAKQVVESTSDDGVQIFEAVNIDDPYKDSLMKLNEGQEKEKCPLCGVIEQLRYDDVLIISQFMRSDQGNLLPRNVTGLCRRAQDRLDTVYHQACKAGLFRAAGYRPIFTPKKLPKRPGWRMPRVYKNQRQFIYDPVHYQWDYSVKVPQT